MCPCDPVVLVSICSSSAELYFSSSIILSLFPIEHCSKEYLASILLTRRGLRCWDTLQTPRFLSPQLTHPLETVCVLLLDLVVALAKFLLVSFFSLEEKFTRAFFLSQQPSLRDFP